MSLFDYDFVKLPPMLKAKYKVIGGDESTHIRRQYVKNTSGGARSRKGRSRKVVLARVVLARVVLAGLNLFG